MQRYFFSLQFMVCCLEILRLGLKYPQLLITLLVLQLLYFKEFIELLAKFTVLNYE